MNRTDSVHIREILAKSLILKNLSLREVSSLIALEDEGLWEEVFETARLVKEKVYGNRVVLFAPLYLSNVCINDCWYCGFRKGNVGARRKSLSVDEAVQEASLLAGKGYRRLLLVTSEHPKLAGLSSRGSNPAVWGYINVFRRPIISPRIRSFIPQVPSLISSGD
jgi:2-iminoacetate synthase